MRAASELCDIDGATELEPLPPSRINGSGDARHGASLLLDGADGGSRTTGEDVAVHGGSGGGGGGDGSASARKSSSVLRARLHEQEKLLVEARAQTRRANAHVRRAHYPWLVARAAAPVLGALVAGLALGRVLGRRPR